MKKITEKLRPVVLLSIFMYGTIGIAYLLVYMGIMRLWVVDCSDFTDIWCSLSSTYLAIAIAALLFFVLGRWLFVSWLKLVSTKQLAIGALALFVMLALKEWSVTQYWTVSESGEYNSVLFDILINYSEIIIIVLTSTAVLYANKLFAAKKKPIGKTKAKTKH